MKRILQLGCFAFALTLGTGCQSADPDNDSATDSGTLQEDTGTVQDTGTGRDTTSQSNDSESTDDTQSVHDSGSTGDTGASSDSGPASDTSPADDTQYASDTGSASDAGNRPGDAAGTPFDNPCNNGPLDEPIEGCEPEPLPSTGNPYKDCVRRINQLRWECQCLPPLERWNGGESCADQMASYDAQYSTPHKGFNDGICSPTGMAQNECPDYNSWNHVIDTCFQQMWNEGPGQDYQQHGHYLAMSSTSYTKVACGAGGDWYVQNFSP